MRKVWVVVSNSSDAKILKAENVNHLVEIRNMEHLESRLPNRDLSADKPGRSTAMEPYSFGPHTMEDKLSPKDREKSYFAEEIASALIEGHNASAYDRLYMIAPPHFIALIKEHLHQEILKLIFQEIHKDVVRLTPKEIREYLPPVL